MSEIMETSFSKEITALSAKDLEFAQVIYKKITEKQRKQYKDTLKNILLIWIL